MWREFVAFAEKRQEPFSAICARFGISRKTGYKWLNRFRAKGEAGLVEQSRRPKTHPQKTSEAIEDLVVSLRSENPEWSAARIRAEIQVKGVASVPAVSTVDLILRRRRELAVRQAADIGIHADAIRFDPNFRWIVQLHAGLRIAGAGPMTAVVVTDEVTRFVVGTFLIPAARREENLRAGMESLLRRHGMPWRMVLPSPRAHTAFTVWLMRMGIGVDFAPSAALGGDGGQRALAAHLARLPAYQRVAVERHLPAHPFAALCETRLENEKSAIDALERLRTRHNFGQTQESMQTRSPISLYRPSRREVPDEIPPLAYAGNAEVRLVSEKGMFTFERRLIHVGRVFAGLEVEIKPMAAADHFLVLFGIHVLGQVDLSDAEAADTTSIPLGSV